jgi:hypothetical protein
LAAAARALEDIEIDDVWADGVSVAHHCSGVGSLVVSDAPIVFGPVAESGIVHPLCVDAARQRRPLVARRSGSRSPRLIVPTSDGARHAVSPESLPPALRVGRVATIKGLVSRPELDGALAMFSECDKAADRWVCRIKGCAQLRILPEKLVPTDESGQEFLRLRFDAIWFLFARICSCCCMLDLSVFHGRLRSLM